MTPEEFVEKLNNWSAGPAVYLVGGPEPTAVARCLEAARALVGPEFADFNYQMFNLAEVPLNQVLAEAGTMPFFKAPKVVVARGAEGPEAEGQARLLKYLTAPNPQTILLLVLEKPDARLKFVKILKEQGAEVVCQAPRGAALNAWVRRRLTAAGLSAEPNAIRLLLDRAGADTALLAAEIEKLSLYALGRGRITVDDIKLVTSLAPGGNVFELGDALGEGRPEEALTILIELLGHEHHLLVLAMIIRHFRLLLKAKTWLWAAPPGPSAGAAKSLGLPPFVAEKYLRQAKALSWAALKRALKLLESAHRQLVTQPVAPQLVMENLALKLSRSSERF